MQLPKVNTPARRPDTARAQHKLRNSRNSTEYVNLNAAKNPKYRSNSTKPYIFAICHIYPPNDQHIIPRYVALVLEGTRYD